MKRIADELRRIAEEIEEPEDGDVPSGSDPASAWADFLFENWMNGNRKDVIDHLKGMGSLKAAATAVILAGLLHGTEDADYQLGVFGRMLGGA